MQRSSREAVSYLLDDDTTKTVSQEYDGETPLVAVSGEIGDEKGDSTDMVLVILGDVF